MHVIFWNDFIHFESNFIFFTKLFTVLGCLSFRRCFSKISMYIMYKWHRIPSINDDYYSQDEDIHLGDVQVLKTRKKTKEKFVCLSIAFDHLPLMNEVVRPMSMTACEAACRSCIIPREFVFHSFNDRWNSSDDSHVTVL